MTAPTASSLAALTLGVDCAFCHHRPPSAAFAALCDECVEWALLPWWKRMFRRHP